MKYCDIIRQFINKKGVVFGSEIEGFAFKPAGTIGYAGTIKEVGDDYVLLDVTQSSSIQGLWYCHISRFFLRP